MDRTSTKSKEELIKSLVDYYEVWKKNTFYKQGRYYNSTDRRINRHINDVILLNEYDICSDSNVCMLVPEHGVIKCMIINKEDDIEFVVGMTNGITALCNQPVTKATMNRIIQAFVNGTINTSFILKLIRTIEFINMKGSKEGGI